jgi:hypothetical protein
MDEKVTILENIIEEVAVALFEKWAHALPEDQRSEENLKTLSGNALEHTRFVVKAFIEKFNAEAESLKNDSN